MVENKRLGADMDFAEHTGSGVTNHTNTQFFYAVDHCNGHFGHIFYAHIYVELKWECIYSLCAHLTPWTN